MSEDACDILVFWSGVVGGKEGTLCCFRLWMESPLDTVRVSGGGMHADTCECVDPQSFVSPNIGHSHVTFTESSTYHYVSKFVLSL